MIDDNNKILILTKSNIFNVDKQFKLNQGSSQLR